MPILGPPVPSASMKVKRVLQVFWSVSEMDSSAYQTEEFVCELSTEMFINYVYFNNLLLKHILFLTLYPDKGRKRVHIGQ